MLACGGPDAAVLSHRTAAALHDLTNVPSGRIDVTTLRRSAPTRDLRVHESRTLAQADIVVEDGLPRTSVARTLTDLAAVLTAHQLRRVCHRAEHRRLLDMTAIATQRPSRPLRAVLAELAVKDPEITRSRLEVRFPRSSTPSRSRIRGSTHRSTGYRVARFTYTDVVHRPDATGRALRALLSAAPSAAPRRAG